MAQTLSVTLPQHGKWEQNLGHPYTDICLLFLFKLPEDSEHNSTAGMLEQLWSGPQASFGAWKHTQNSIKPLNEILYVNTFAQQIEVSKSKSAEQLQDT